MGNERRMLRDIGAPAEWYFQDQEYVQGQDYDCLYGQDYENYLLDLHYSEMIEDYLEYLRD